MEKVHDSKIFQVVKNIATTNPTPGKHFSQVNFQVGEAFVTTVTGILMDAATSSTLTEDFKIGVKLTNGQIQWSDVINAKSIKSISALKYTPATMQVDIIGFNGTSGSIDVIDNNLYHYKMILLPGLTSGFQMQRMKFGSYKSGDSTTQYSIALNLTKSIVSWLQSEPEFKFRMIPIAFCERLNSGTSSAIADSETVSVTHDSEYIQASGTAHALAVGDYIRIGHATNKSYPVYKIVSVSDDIIKLDMKYQGKSASGLAAGEVTIGTDWGIRITGNTLYFDAPKFNYEITRWSSTMSGFGETTYSTTGANMGSGVGLKVVELESELQLQEGNWYRGMVPAPTYRKEASETGTYAMISIEFAKKIDKSIEFGVTLWKEHMIACEKGAGQGYTDANTGLGTVLDALISKYSIPKYLGGSTITAILNA